MRVSQSNYLLHQLDTVQSRCVRLPAALTLHQQLHPPSRPAENIARLTFHINLYQRKGVFGGNGQYVVKEQC